jgi:hypothetical protein
VATEFAQHKEDIQCDLSIHASISINAAATSIEALNKKMDHLMKIVFTRMRSSEEHELAAFVDDAGGAEVVTNDDELLEELYTRHSSRQEERIRPNEEQHTPADRRKDIAKNIDQIIKVTKSANKRAVANTCATSQENEKIFDQKFEAQRLQIEQLKSVMHHESDRVIRTLLGGPHERIVDKVRYLTFCFIKLTYNCCRICMRYGRIWYFKHSFC